MKFQPLAEALADFKRGKPLIVVDDPGRENEGDVVVAAEKATPAVINFMAKEARGLICVPMLGSDLDRLNVHPMVERGEPREAAFTVSVDARKGVTTGISAHDRARTVRALVDPKTKPDDLRRPGHIFPVALQRRRRSGSFGSHGSSGGFGPVGGVGSGGGDLRNHERRRVHEPASLSV
jgi:3,4-dihydroxy 2-butanone 4-phosphate synthase/GTP cyclohydrolase II